MEPKRARALGYGACYAFACMSRVFILGAGASVFADYPLATDLWQWTLDHHPGERMAGLRREETMHELAPVLQQFARPDGRFDLEEVFTFLDLAVLGRGPLVGAVPNWPNLRNQVKGMIAHAFRWYQLDLAAAVLDREPHVLTSAAQQVRAVADQWGNLIQPGDRIITFNWDLLHESILWRARKWHFCDGYGFPGSNASPHPHSPTLLLKLHGSVNWAQYRDRDAHAAIVDKAFFFPGTPPESEREFDRTRTDWSDGHRLIIPTYLKDISTNALLLQVWREAAHALEQATELIVIGSQLNRADAPARLLMALTLGANNGLRELVVVAPPRDPTQVLAPDHWEDFGHNIGKEVRFVRMKFEEFLLWGANA